jgi:hypothetical protein
MHFKLDGKDMFWPDTIGNWSKVGTARDATSAFLHKTVAAAQLNKILDAHLEGNR